MKHCLLLVWLLFAFTSCTTDTTSKVETETALNNTEKNIQTKEISSNTMEHAHEIPAPIVNTTVQPEDAGVENSNPYGFFYDISNPYKEYINNLKYLDDLDAKIPMATTTVDMVVANENALNAWDKELNKIYALLLDKLSTEDIEKLKSEERLWIKGKEEKANAIESLGGSQAAADANYFLFMETKQRTLELIHDYLESSFFNDGDTDRAKLYFAVIDMDEDGISEVVVKGIYESGNVAMSRILHYEDGTVYGYFFGARELDDLKKDGSFSWSGGSRYQGFRFRE